MFKLWSVKNDSCDDIFSYKTTNFKKAIIKLK